MLEIKLIVLGKGTPGVQWLSLVRLPMQVEMVKRTRATQGSHSHAFEPTAIVEPSQHHDDMEPQVLGR